MSAGSRSCQRARRRHLDLVEQFVTQGLELTKRRPRPPGTVLDHLTES